MLDGLHGGQSCVPSSRPVSISISSLSLLPRCFYMDGSNHPIRRTLYRLKLVSSPNLTQLGKSEKASLEDRGNGPNAVWNSIHNAVIGVFQRKGLADNELYALNEGVRQLLKTELGSFFTEYLQKQLLTKGMVILRDKIRFYEGQKLLDSLAETWDFFFGDVLSMLQAIFHPVQGVHESRGVSEEYIRLEALLQRVVSPYLGTQGLRSHQNPLSECSYTLDKHLHWAWSKPGDAHTVNPVVRSKSYNIPMLTPVAEYDSEVGSLGSVGIRRHSACEVSACLEQPGYPMLGTTVDTGSTPRLCLEHDLPLRGAPVQPGLLSSAIFPPHCAGTLHPPGGQPCHPELAKAHSSPASCSSSPETTIVQGLDSLDSDQEGIFIDFSHCRSESYGTTRQTS
ncbi:proline-rich protein 5a isoform X3 [Sardina pilchardus]|uniref:proline-rich protein 5a isoform X3 n=1 Tax=Sardina pilchardus TaxID=27697 RepID=UPI002E13986C